MISRLQAGAAGLPFMPMNQTAATSLEQANPLIRRVLDPYSGREVVTVPALNPDVAIVHVQRADANGNTHLWEIIGEQKKFAFAAKPSILRPPKRSWMRQSFALTRTGRLFPASSLRAVCHVPYASHPSYAQGYYDRDNDFYLKWDKISESIDAVKSYLDEWVYGVKDRAAYWEKLGADVHERLNVRPKFSEAVNYGDY